MMQSCLTKGKSKLGWGTQEQDLISLLFTVEGKTWKEISAVVNEKFPNHKRNAKQCRERYCNFIKFKKENKNPQAWTVDEEKMLLELYMTLGSKWTQISDRFKSRSPNEVKNKFYGSIRRLIRRINDVVKNVCPKSSRKAISYESIFRLLSLQSSSTSYKNPQLQDKQNFITALKHRLLQLVIEPQRPVLEQQGLEIGQKMSKFNILTRVDRLQWIKKLKSPSLGRRKHLPPLKSKQEQDNNKQKQQEKKEKEQTINDVFDAMGEKDGDDGIEKYLWPVSQHQISMKIEIDLSQMLNFNRRDQHDFFTFYD